MRINVPKRHAGLMQTFLRTAMATEIYTTIKSDCHLIKFRFPSEDCNFFGGLLYVVEITNSDLDYDEHEAVVLLELMGVEAAQTGELLASLKQRVK